jgi:hypothetical protein
MPLRKQLVYIIDIIYLTMLMGKVPLYTEKHTKSISKLQTARFFIVKADGTYPGRDTDHSPPSSAEVVNE